MNNTNFIPGMVSGDWTELVFNCFHNNQFWNGWAMPYFQHDEAVKVAEHLNMTYDKDADSFILIEEAYPDEPVVFAPIFINVNCEEIKVWGIGAGFHCWDLED